jgi:hypothetical protein
MKNKFIFELELESGTNLVGTLINDIIQEVRNDIERKKIERINYIRVSDKMKEVLEVIKEELNIAIKPLGLHSAIVNPDSHCYNHELFIYKKDNTKSLLSIEICCPTPNVNLVFEPYLFIRKYCLDKSYRKYDFISIDNLIETHKPYFKDLYLQGL